MLLQHSPTLHVKWTPMPLQVAAAAALWDGTGSLLFTSSAGLFTVDDGTQVPQLLLDLTSNWLTN